MLVTIVYFLVKLFSLVVIIGSGHFILETFNKGKKMSVSDVVFSLLAIFILATFIDVYNMVY